MTNKFYVKPYDSLDKRICVIGPGSFSFWIDNDDVDSFEIAAAIPIVLEALNSIKTWPKVTWSDDHLEPTVEIVPLP